MAFLQVAPGLILSYSLSWGKIPSRFLASPMLIETSLPMLAV